MAKVKLEDAAEIEHRIKKAANDLNFVLLQAANLGFSVNVATTELLRFSAAVTTFQVGVDVTISPSRLET